MALRRAFRGWCLFGLAARGALVSVGGGRADLRRADLRRAGAAVVVFVIFDSLGGRGGATEKTAILTDGSFRNSGTYTGDASPMC